LLHDRRWLRLCSRTHGPEEAGDDAATAAAVQADEVFWEVFHGGAYEEIPQALETVTASVSQDPA